MIGRMGTMLLPRESTERRSLQLRQFVAEEAAVTGASELEILERLSVAAERGGSALISREAPDAWHEFRELVAAEIGRRVTT
jgi:hypothetical protein